MCARCARDLPDDARFCLACGAPVGPDGGDTAESLEAPGGLALETPAGGPEHAFFEFARRQRERDRRLLRITLVVAVLSLVLALAIAATPWLPGGRASWRRAAAPPPTPATATPPPEPVAAAPSAVARAPLPDHAPPAAEPRVAEAPRAPGKPHAATESHSAAEPDAAASGAPAPAVEAESPAAGADTGPELPPRTPRTHEPVAAPPPPARVSPPTRLAPRTVRARRPAPVPRIEEGYEPSAAVAPSAPPLVLGDIAVEVRREAGGGGGEVREYRVLLKNAVGAPFTGLHVALQGRMADGRIVRAALDPAGTPGVYGAHVRLHRDGPRDLRLLISRGWSTVEVPLAN